MYDDRRGGSVFGAFLLGGLIGAVLGLLFAPRSGKETRDLIAEKSGEYWGQAGEVYVAGKEKVTDAVVAGQQTAAEKGEQLRSKIDEARGRLQDQVAKSATGAKDKIAETTPAVHALSTRRLPPPSPASRRLRARPRTPSTSSPRRQRRLTMSRLPTRSPRAPRPLRRSSSGTSSW